MSQADPNPPAAATGAGYAESAGGVRIHVRTAGDSDRPLIVCLHGFPDDSRTWRPIVPRLAEHYHVAMPDLRGYMRSGKPEGVENYRMDKLVGDVVAVVRHMGRRRCVLVAHDWGAIIAQHVAIHIPRLVERLVLLNIPHLNGMMRELASNRRQQAASWYARLVRGDVPLGPFDRQILARQLGGGRGIGHTLGVMRRSDVTAMLNYYRANFPPPPYRFDEALAARLRIATPTLIVFGTRDPFVLADGLRDNEQWFDGPVKIVTRAHAGHWVHHDEPGVVAETMLTWLATSDVARAAGP